LCVESPTPARAVVGGDSRGAGGQAEPCRVLALRSEQLCAIPGSLPERHRVAFDAPLGMGRKWGAELGSLNLILNV